MQIQHALQLSKALLGSSFSGLEGLVDDLLPQSGGLLAVEQEFLPGKNSAKTKSWTLPRKENAETLVVTLLLKKLSSM